MPPESRYLTPAEIEATGLADADTVRAWIASGQLKAVNAGKSPNGGKPRWKVLQSDLDEFLACRANKPAPAPQQPKPRRRRPPRAKSTIKFF